MTRDQFIQRRKADWIRFEELLLKAEETRTPKLSGAEISEFSGLYRSLCFDLSLVQSRDWGLTIGRYLNGLASRGHNCFYRSQPGSLLGLIRFVSEGFPRLLRQNHVYFWVALALFVVPGLIAGWLVALDDTWAGRIVSGQHQAQFESMYSKTAEVRSAGVNSVMAGFYVYNNVGIAFRCFATGCFAGLGTIFFLIYNSIFIGTVAGFLIARGHSGRFFEFVIGHGSFELTAIVISGAAGLILGHAIVHPGSRSRWDALRVRGLVAVQIASGAALMLAVAAMIEGYWSPSQVDGSIKYAVGALLWLAVILYLGLAGRRGESVSHAA